MPAALDVNWGEVRTLAVAVGVREAARRMGLPEGAVMMRSSREGWLANLPRSQPLPATMVRAVSGVSSAPKALAQVMLEDSQDCRSTALRVAKRALRRVERCDDDELLMPEVAGVLNQHTKTASVAGNWQGSAPSLKIQFGATSTTAPITMEAEIVSSDAAQMTDDELLAGF